MGWKCPDCGVNNDDDGAKECSCGYAFYKVLGVKPDASEEEVKQAYKYLANVWQPERFTNDPVLEKKAKEKLKNIKEAYNRFKHYASALKGDKKQTVSKKTLAAAGVIVLAVIVLIVFLNISKGPPQPTRTAGNVAQQPSSPEQSPPEQAAPEAPGESQTLQGRPEFNANSFDELMRQRQQTPSITQAELPADMNPEDRAIELVKRSRIIDRLTDTETLMRKWTDDNSDKYQIIGWKAKKMEEQIYMVSYTATDGLAMKGFYFDIDLNTDAVRHIGNHPELQKKYGIQYNQ